MNGSSMELAMDRGITDATDEKIIGYIDDCAPVEPYPSI